VLVIAWVLFRGNPESQTPTTAPSTSPKTAQETPQAVRAAPATPPPTPAPAPSLSAAPEANPAETVNVTPELRQERLELFQKLEQGNDPTLAAIRKSLTALGITQPEAAASSWILAQNWAIAARAEALVAAKIEDETQRRELAEVRQRILIRGPISEMRGLLGAEPNPTLLAELESLGRSLKDSPPPQADLLPDRAAGAARRDAKRPKSDLPSEEE
jgi:hypothetical protein